MAALIVRSPTTLLWSQGTSKLSPAEDRLKPTHVRYPKRLGYFPALALSLSKSSDSIFHGSFLPRVAYQALHYAYSESVARKLYPNYEAVPCQQYHHVFEAFKRGVADVAVLQIDPMSHYDIYDPLLNQGLHIVGGANVTIKGYIDQRAAVFMSMGLDDPAAGTAKNHNKPTDELVLIKEYTNFITGERMGQYFRKKKEDIVAPFLMLAKEPIIPVTDRPVKTSIVFSLDCHPDQALAKAYHILCRRPRIKFDYILSRHRHEWMLQESLRDSIWNINNRIPKYVRNLIYVDFEASVVDQDLQNILNDIKVFTRFLRVLGSYNIVDTITLNVDKTGAVS